MVERFHGGAIVKGSRVIVSIVLVRGERTDERMAAVVNGPGGPLNTWCVIDRLFLNGATFNPCNCRRREVVCSCKVECYLKVSPGILALCVENIVYWRLQYAYRRFLSLPLSYT